MTELVSGLSRVLYRRRKKKHSDIRYLYSHFEGQFGIGCESNLECHLRSETIYSNRKVRPYVNNCTNTHYVSQLKHRCTLE